LFQVYILENRRGGFYVGSTDDVARRLAEHNDLRGNTYTHKHGPWSLVWQQEFTTRSEATHVHLKNSFWRHTSNSLELTGRQQVRVPPAWLRRAEIPQNVRGQNLCGNRDLQST
jgi:putative endonuclease